MRALRQLGTRENEAILVEGDLGSEPPGTRFRSDQHDHGTGIEYSTLSRAHILDGDPLHVPLATDLAHLVTEQHVDTTILRDAIAQVSRHRTLDTVSTNHE